jgi:hypothetical protein
MRTAAGHIFTAAVVGTFALPLVLALLALVWVVDLVMPADLATLSLGH